MNYKFYKQWTRSYSEFTKTSAFPIRIPYGKKSVCKKSHLKKSLLKIISLKKSLLKKSILKELSLKEVF